jgi:tetratricopeptide (TPR) repeat protein
MSRVSDAMEQPRPERLPQRERRQRRRRYLLAVALLFGSTASGLWVYHWYTSPAFDVPAIDVADVDPEVAEAIANARSAVGKQPRSADAWGKLAMVLDAHAYREQAVACYANAAKLDERNPCWPYLEGLIRRAGPQPATALVCFERAARLTPPNSLPRLNLADLLAELGRFEEAAAEYHTVVAANPDDAHARLGLAQLAVTRGQYAQALPHLQLLAKNPFARKRAAVLATLVHGQLGDTAAASRERQRLAALPEDPPWPDEAVERVEQMRVGLRRRLQEAHTLSTQGHYAEAREILEDAVRRYPHSDAAWSTLGRHLVFTKDFPAADRAMHKSVELAPARAEHWLYLGIARRAQRHCPEALAALRTSINLRPTDGVAHLEMGKCLLEQGDRAGAAEAFRQALQYRPDLDEARQLLASLKSES